jgi:hypothetical protein
MGPLSLNYTEYSVAMLHRYLRHGSIELFESCLVKTQPDCKILDPGPHSPRLDFCANVLLHVHYLLWLLKQQAVRVRLDLTFWKASNDWLLMVR